MQVRIVIVNRTFSPHLPALLPPSPSWGSVDVGALDENALAFAAFEVAEMSIDESFDLW